MENYLEISDGEKPKRFFIAREKYFSSEIFFKIEYKVAFAPIEEKSFFQS